MTYADLSFFGCKFRNNISPVADDIYLDENPQLKTAGGSKVSVDDDLRNMITSCQYCPMGSSGPIYPTRKLDAKGPEKDLKSDDIVHLRS